MGLFGKNSGKKDEKQTARKNESNLRRHENRTAKQEARTRRYDAQTKAKADKAAAANKARSEGRPVKGFGFMVMDTDKGKTGRKGTGKKGKK